MRLTVGPLPPAVYWRRRVIVLVALLVGLLLLVYNCAGDKPSGAVDSVKPPASTGSATPLLTPVVGAAANSAAADAGPSVDPSVPPQQTGPCGDAEIAVSVAIESGKTEIASGAYVRIFLKIKNASSRTCTRDVGALAQELRIQQGAQKLWSSDDCGTGANPAPDLHTFRPGEQMDQFNVVWNGRASTNCQTKPPAAAGAYQLIGRFGTKWSEPVAITVTG